MFHPSKVVDQHISLAREARGPTVEWEDETAWLRARIIRLRRLLRHVKDSQVEAGLKEFIGDAEARLEMLEGRRINPLSMEDPPGG